jgi:hypothetical protein
MEWGASDVLVSWLRLLGWRVELSCRGGMFVAVATRCEDDERDLVAGAVSARLEELPLAIFTAVFARLEEERAPNLEEAPALVVA